MLVLLAPEVLPDVLPAVLPLVEPVPPVVEPVVEPVPVDGELPIVPVEPLVPALPEVVVPLPVVLPVVPVPAVVPEVPAGCVVLVPAVVPVVPEVPLGCVMVPPLAPSVPPVVAPWPVTEFCVESEVSLVAEAPDLVPSVVLLLADCANAPPATTEATNRLRSLLIQDLLMGHLQHDDALQAPDKDGRRMGSRRSDVGSNPSGDAPTRGRRCLVLRQCRRGSLGGGREAGRPLSRIAGSSGFPPSRE